MPYVFVQCGMGAPLPHIPRPINPLTPGLAWVRGMDTLPILTSERAIRREVEALDERRQRLRSRRS
jgi:hypothetical protein